MSYIIIIHHNYLKSENICQSSNICDTDPVSHQPPQIKQYFISAWLTILYTVLWLTNFGGNQHGRLLQSSCEAMEQSLDTIHHHRTVPDFSERILLCKHYNRPAFLNGRPMCVVHHMYDVQLPLRSRARAGGPPLPDWFSVATSPNET
jgi:hypothetical protein